MPITPLEVSNGRHYMITSDAKDAEAHAQTDDRHGSDVDPKPCSTEGQHLQGQVETTLLYGNDDNDRQEERRDDLEDTVPNRNVPRSLQSQQPSYPHGGLGSIGEEPQDPDFLKDIDHVPASCRGCSKIIEEGHAFELAGNRWHIECFRCSTCDAKLESDENLLLLGDGTLICNTCTYACAACGQNIEEMAIMTGDKAYCASCFRCRECDQKIENLRYARDSQGLCCMDCHENSIYRRLRQRKQNPVSPSGFNRHIEGTRPQRRNRRVRDPYAIDTDSDQLSDNSSTPTVIARNEESLADFLRSTYPPPKMKSPQQKHRRGRDPYAIDTDSDEINERPPSGIILRKDMSLAEFLRNGPPLPDSKTSQLPASNAARKIRAFQNPRQPPKSSNPNSRQVIRKGPPSRGLRPTSAELEKSLPALPPSGFQATSQAATESLAKE